MIREQACETSTDSVDRFVAQLKREGAEIVAVYHSSLCPMSIVVYIGDDTWHLLNS